MWQGRPPAVEKMAGEGPIAGNAAVAPQSHQRCGRGGGDGASPCT
jgi:hypothetical protein